MRPLPLTPRERGVLQSGASKFWKPVTPSLFTTAPLAAVLAAIALAPSCADSTAARRVDAARNTLPPPAGTIGTFGVSRAVNRRVRSAHAALLAGGQVVATEALAHGAVDATRWSFDPWVTLPLAVAALLYIAGVRALWMHAGRGRGVSRRQVMYFAVGWWTLVAALLSPLDAVADELFSVHMIQHELLMVVAAPLLVLARPLGVWTWAVPRRWRPHLRDGVKTGLVHRPWRALTAPLSAWLLHAAALWLWHLPAFFSAAARSEAIHTLQHATFLTSALLFWWAVLGGATARSRAAAVLMLFTTMVHMGVLGALLTLAPAVLYEPYVATTVARGLDPLEDQQLGGLLMWIPAGTAYLVAAVFLAAKLLKEDAGARGWRRESARV